ncbi:acyl-CoA dehydrogenase family protein [Pimelobacter simplex]|uniref:acyl-CoA dehydrogenase family protein n=1 Tax=Nocardioides simplex TaxID=2045 RepID=UPI0021503614|nr:acyl-CoA dehydrogenase family protein [Pimelobacter simplex]UUW91457.1 acyl-CoA dehydrogenase family protein [Pimelobacter simplex]UUW95285.1 acyl-CoA dehydrogenase family protein [Pimelobacter simplex]
MTLDSLRQEVRAFLAEQRAAGAITTTADSWLSGWDEDFTRALAQRGWLGMTIPTAYGGHGRSYVERFVVTEELLAAGAPVSAHWIADRQIGPSLLRFGTEEQKQRFLPRIARGECYFAIGMSEPDAGSDLAAVRTRATRVDGGWELEGGKVWTSGAHQAHAFIALVRTTPRAESGRHEGLTQLIVHLDAPGVTVRPIASIDGNSHFNEVLFASVFVPDADVLGEVGSGWRQVTSELGFERSGPERFLSTFPALAAVLRAHQDAGAAGDPDLRLGRSLTRLAGLHQLSSQVSQVLQDGGEADLLASMVKVMGTLGEGDIADLVAEHATSGPAAGDPLVGELARLSLLRRPGFTLRGGTNEILRGIIAGRIAPGALPGFAVDDDYAAMVGQVLADHAERQVAGELDAALWKQLAELGLTRLTGAEASGGSAAGWAEAGTLHRLAAYHGVALPLAEHDLLAGWLAEALGLPVDDRVTTLAVARADGALVAPFGRYAERVLAVLPDGRLLDLAPGEYAVDPGSDLAGEARDVIVPVDPAAGAQVDRAVLDELHLRGALVRAAQLCGALERCVDLAVEHASVREQFGRPLVKFQAVQALLAEAAAETALAQAATQAALLAGPEDLERAVAVAKACASHAAGVVTRNAHQVLGAIGTTTEHALGRFTGRLLTWRDDFGTRDGWDRVLGRAAVVPGADVWALVAGS